MTELMKFESLELIGFKSFAEKTRVVLDDRITAIIGPNGCGKSNISDAIGWVLGTQSAHSLRGQKMEDVIFAGTRKRKPSGVTQVTLSLKGSSEQTIEVNGRPVSLSTLEVSRKLYRSGESVYSINKSRCRLKDIHQVLEAAGIGFSPYALIAQGRIDWFLRAKPLERRSLIEEAAQISGYKNRRRNAELKLELAEQNLLRVSDIISEVELQLRSLKRQAARARRYRELKETFKAVQRQRLALEYRCLHQQDEALRAELEKQRTGEERLRQQLAEEEKGHRKLLEERERLEVLLSDLQRKKNEVRLERERTKQSLQYHREQIEAIGKRLEINGQERENLILAASRLDNEKESFHRELVHLEDEEGRVLQALQEQQESVQRCQTEVEAAEAGLEALRARMIALSGETASLRNRKDQIEHRIKINLADRQRSQSERSLSATRSKELAQKKQELKKSIRAGEAALEKVRSQLEGQARRRSELEQSLSDLRAQSEENQAQLIACRERLQSLQELELNRSQYSHGVQKFLNHLSKNKGLQAQGTLADFIDTRAEFERLVEEFLDDELEYVLVDSLEEAMHGVSELKSLKSGKCTFLALRSNNGFGKGGSDNGHSLQQQEGVFGRLSDLLEMSPGVEEAFQRVLPQQANAIVVSDMNRAVQLFHSYPENIFITLDGDAMTPRGLISATSPQSRKLGLLGLKRQKRELQKKLSGLEQTRAALQKRLEEQEASREVLARKSKELESSLHELEKDQVGFELQQAQLLDEEQRQERALRVLDEEASRLETEAAQFREELSEISDKLSASGAEQIEVEALIAQRREDLEQLKAELGRLQERLHMASSDQKVMGERRLSLNRALERLQEQAQALQERQQALADARERDSSRLGELEASLQELQQRLVQCTQQEEESQTSLASLEGEYSQLKEGFTAAEEKLEGLRGALAERREQRGKLEVDGARFETQLNNLSEQCLDQVGVNLLQVVAGVSLEEADSETVIQEYQGLKQRLEEFGPINMTALDEYQELEERHQFLSGQKEDIERSISDTVQAIQEINRRSREKFARAFKAIDDHFKEVFQELFGGGECGMQLLDEEDLLESGIEIHAQPPGKKLQNVMLLSGGEKAMTGLALLMALFKYRPSRFCVLDEVDAPLDDANVGRFTELLFQMSERTQFIVMTHNKKTMEAAQTLFGVTMEEAGISSIYSARF